MQLLSVQLQGSLRWTPPPHPVIVTIRDNRDYIGILLFSSYTTITGWGVLLKDHTLTLKNMRHVVFVLELRPVRPRPWTITAVRTSIKVSGPPKYVE